MQHFGNDMEQKELSCSGSRSVNWFNHFGKKLALFCKVKVTNILQHSCPLLATYLREIYAQDT